ncbi:hypothetical protein [Afipia felis]
MTFASSNFLLYFFPLFLIFYFLSKTVKVKNAVVVAFSLIFYSASAPAFLVLLIVSIGVNYRLGLGIDERADDRRRYRLLAWGCVGNLLALGVFKYTGFLIENLNVVLAAAGLHIPVPPIGLPLGISFYSFHAISYLADVAKRKVTANRRFDQFMLYMSMFPQLVAGPIVRYSTVARQLNERRALAWRWLDVRDLGSPPWFVSCSGARRSLRGSKTPAAPDRASLHSARGLLGLGLVQG